MIEKYLLSINTTLPKHFFQRLVKGNSFVYKKIVLAVIGVYGTTLIILEIVFYINIHLYFIMMNKNVGAKVLKISVINERNHKNAITLTGQVATCFIEFWYLLVVPILSNFLDIELLREVAPIIKHFDVLLVPLVQIYTSPPLKAFMSNQ